MHFLDKVQLAYECPLRWEKLVGGETRRFCATCQKHVTNLSAMTRLEAETLLRDAATPICVRVEVDAQGRAVHRPALAAAALAAAGLALAGCGPGLGETADTGPETGGLPIAELTQGGASTHEGSGVGRAGPGGAPETGITSPAGARPAETGTLIPELSFGDAAKGGVVKTVTEIVYPPDTELVGKIAAVPPREMLGEAPPLELMGAPAPVRIVPPPVEVGADGTVAPPPPEPPPVAPPTRMGRLARHPR